MIVSYISYLLYLLVYFSGYQHDAFHKPPTIPRPRNAHSRRGHRVRQERRSLHLPLRMLQSSRPCYSYCHFGRNYSIFCYISQGNSFLKFIFSKSSMADSAEKDARTIFCTSINIDQMYCLKVTVGIGIYSYQTPPHICSPGVVKKLLSPKFNFNLKFPQFQIITGRTPYRSS